VKKFSLALLALATALAITPMARADSTTFDFTAVTPNVGLYGSGTLVGTPDTTTAGAYDITSGTATFNGVSANLVATSSPGVMTDNPVTVDNTYFAYDNIIPLDATGGLFFQLSTGSLLEFWSIGNADYYNELVDNGGSYTWLFNNEQTSPYGDPVNFTATATPEPSSLLFMGTGLLGLAVVLFRKNKPSSVVLHS